MTSKNAEPAAKRPLRRPRLSLSVWANWEMVGERERERERAINEMEGYGNLLQSPVSNP